VIKARLEIRSVRIQRRRRRLAGKSAGMVTMMLAITIKQTTKSGIKFTTHDKKDDGNYADNGGGGWWNNRPNYCYCACLTCRTIVC